MSISTDLQTKIRRGGVRCVYAAITDEYMKKSHTVFDCDLGDLIIALHANVAGMATNIFPGGERWGLKLPKGMTAKEKEIVISQLIATPLTIMERQHFAGLF